MDYKTLHDFLKPFIADQSVLNESWGFLTLKGVKKNVQLDDLSKLHSFLLGFNKQNVLTIKIDNDDITIDDLKDFISNNTVFSGWEISLNKSSLLSNDSGNTSNFFVQLDKLIEWLSELDPFSEENPFHKFSPLVIFSDGISQPIIGNSFQILPFGPVGNFWNSTLKIPQSIDVNKVVHSIATKEVTINPAHFVFASVGETELEMKLYKLAALALAASVANEFYSTERIIVDGIRRIELKLFNSNDSISKTTFQNLLTLVSWIYEEKVATRQKLFADRITLELDENKSFVAALIEHLETSLLQAQQRYNFVILERKDKYISELKDLLKDIRSQSDLYSQKIRTLLNNLLRDVLAAIVLVGFTLFTKFSDNILLDKELLLTYVFNGLALYYLISIVLQAIIDLTDINISNKEILYWKNTTKELLPEKEFKTHIDKSLKSRRISLRIIYPLIAFVYLLVAVACFKFPVYFKKISTEKVIIENDKIPQHTTPKDSCSQGGK